MSEQIDLSRMYREEAAELLEGLEGDLLELEKSPDDSEIIGRIFRAMHTIKGSGAAVGFEYVANFTHDVETLMSSVRDGSVPVNKDIIDLILLSRDHISKILEASDGESDPDPDPEEAALIGARISGILGTGLPARTALPIEQPSIHVKAAPRRSYHIRFKPPADILTKGLDPNVILDELRCLGDCIVIAQLEDIPLLDRLDTSRCYTFWDVIITTDSDEDAVRDVFLFLEGDAKVSIRHLYDEAAPGSPDERRKLTGEILLDRGDVTESALGEVLVRRKKIGEKLVESGITTPGKVESALAEQKVIETHLTNRPASIRVSTDKLDKLINLAGELVITQARLSSISSSADQAGFDDIVEVLGRLTAELRDNIMSVRMVPIQETFHRYKRLFRDLCVQTGKKALFVTEGGDTELDKTVMEKLNDPIVHLIRNCIDHGIETPDERVRKGKPETGTLRISAAHKGGKVVISVGDDGDGLDMDAIRANALSSRLVEPGQNIGPGEALELIFRPGFSTSKTVNSVSGRGVGLDVVRRQVEQFRGTVKVESVKGLGTTFVLSLPLTLAIIDGLLVQVSGSHYVIPLHSVSECVEVSGRSGQTSASGDFIDIRGELVPCSKLRSLFGISGEPPALEHIVIVEDGGRKIGISVDQVVGEHQTVIKPLNGACGRDGSLAGATILGDGRLALILDVRGIIRLVELQAGSRIDAA